MAPTCANDGRASSSQSIPDLLVAAMAARNVLTVVHYDSDYEVIATVTGQATRWAAPRGTI